MTNSENDLSKKQTPDNNIYETSDKYEDEINLIDYFRVLWKRKWFISVVSVLPALVVGLTIFFSPRDYTITFTYNTGLDEKSFTVLEGKFYSEENLEKLVEALKKGGFDECARKMANAKTNKGLKKLVSFGILPSYFGTTEPSKTKSLEELQKLQQARGFLLSMCIRSKSEGNIREMALVCRNNFEQIIPLYSERDRLNSGIINLKESIAAIVEGRYLLNLQLKRRKSTLKELKKTGTEDLSKLPTGVVLQFNNIENSGGYLPLPYQIQAVETQVINLEEQIRANGEKLSYYAHLLALNERLFNHITKVIPSLYTLEQFYSFLNSIREEYKDQELPDYLEAYIKRVENVMASNMPLMEKPKVYPVDKGTVKKTAIVFAVALMLSIFSALLLEGLEKNRVRLS